MKKVLFIYYNEYYPRIKTKYVKVVCDDFGETIKEHEYKRKPTRAIFDEVYENGSGGRIAHRDNRLYKHSLLKKL